MYTVAVNRSFTARHFLPSAPGDETREHPHEYRLELSIEGEALDTNGYLVDIDQLKYYLDNILTRFRGKLLNQVPDFDSLDPSLENFARIVCALFRDAGVAPQLSNIAVRIWEDESAWAGYREGR